VQNPEPSQQDGGSPKIATFSAQESAEIRILAGIVIGTGEIFGGSVAPAIAGGIAQNYSIQYRPYFALAGQSAGLVVGLFLRETAPRKARSPRPAGCPIVCFRQSCAVQSRDGVVQKQ
jgi:hypothetical protein